MLLTVLLILFVLVVAGDDRHVGLVADGRQMIRTAVALVETGELGQAVGRDFTIERPAGDAISRFGMATSLLQVPAAWLAPRVEAKFGAGSSQALFLVLPWLAVGVAAAAAGRIARMLGADPAQVVAAALLASLASPLASYASLEFSEPVQAAALVGALVASLASATAPSARRGLEVIAGFAAGAAVLTKSSLLIAAPFTLLPLVDIRDGARTARALTRAAVGAALPLAMWTAFEFTRFGRLFGGYPDDRFTHPWFDGLWRLLAGPNRGLLLFWPALVLFLWWGVKARIPAVVTTPAGRAWLAAAAVFAIQLAVAAGYWGWHGMEGWGPRLLLSSVPLMAPFAALSTARRAVLAAAVTCCAVANLPPLVQHPTPVATYLMNLAWPEIAQQEAPRYPFYATAQTPAGRPTVVPFQTLERTPAANPWRLYTWFWQASRLDDVALAERLQAPPWQHERPELVPAAPWPPEVARRIAPAARVGFLGRSLTGVAGPYATVYLDALLDQVIRANQQGRIERALTLSQKRMDLRLDGETAAWRLESLRRADRALEAEALLRSLPEETRRDPRINVVLALFDRQFREETRARALLQSVADAFPHAPIQTAVSTPLTAWPETLDAMIRTPRRDAAVSRPR